MTSSRPAPVRDLLLHATWAAVGFGVVEGALHVVLRHYPALQAAHKLGPIALWVAPLGNLPILLGVALGLALLARRWPGLGSAALAWGVFATLGGAAVLRAPEVLHPATVVLLGLGIGTVAFRMARAREAELTSVLRRWLPVLPAVLLLLAGGTAFEEWLTERRRRAALPSPAAGRPDVLILLLDTVRRDRLGGGRSLTPTLDSLAAAGASFTNAWAPSSWSLPSQASILTGRHAHRHGANWPTLRLDDSIPTLAEAFRDAGFATGAFSSNHAWITPEYLGRGFTRFRVYRPVDVWERTTAGRVATRVLALFGRRAGAPSLPAAQSIDAFLAFADAYPDRPWFGYLCFMDVNRAFYDQLVAHPVWEPKHSMTSAIAAYDRALTRLDADVARLLAALRERGRLERTILVVTSDHGESFGSAEASDHEPTGHGTTLYPEQVRVPLFVVAPAQVAPGRRLAAATSLIDLPDMALTLAGLRDPRFAPAAATAALQAPATADSIGAIYATLDYDEYSARSSIEGTVQYLVTRSGAPAGEQLFDLAVDSLARRSLPADDPRWSSLRTLLHRYDPAAGPPTGGSAASPR